MPPRFKYTHTFTIDDLLTWQTGDNELRWVIEDAAEEHSRAKLFEEHPDLSNRCSYGAINTEIQFGEKEITVTNTLIDLDNDDGQTLPCDNKPCDQEATHQADLLDENGNPYMTIHLCTLCAEAFNWGSAGTQNTAHPIGDDPEDSQEPEGETEPATEEAP